MVLGMSHMSEDISFLSDIRMGYGGMSNKEPGHNHSLSLSSILEFFMGHILSVPYFLGADGALYMCVLYGVWLV